MTTMIPPSKNYGLPPSSYKMKPPHKKYIPPVSSTYMGPPSKDYLPPKQVSSPSPVHAKRTKMIAPTKGYAAPTSFDYSVPTKEYLPPPNVAHSDQGYSAPSGYDYSAPTKEYLPPPNIAHSDHSLHLTPHNAVLDTHSHAHPVPHITHVNTHLHTHDVPYHKPLNLGPIFDHPYCKNIRQKAHEFCTEAHDTCWNTFPLDAPGDCPDDSICCFDGCRRTCVAVLHGDSRERKRLGVFPNISSEDPSINYPPNIAYLSPEHTQISAEDVYLWRKHHGSASTPRSIDFDDHIPNIPAGSYRPPKYDIQKGHPLGDLVDVHHSKRPHLRPPSHDFKKPRVNKGVKATYLPPPIDYKIPNHLPAINHRSGEYQPPKVHPDLSLIHI